MCALREIEECIVLTGRDLRRGDGFNEYPPFKKIEYINWAYHKLIQLLPKTICCYPATYIILIKRKTHPIHNSF
jgi:hypothetical protein